jgi:hypothetical protein
MISPQTNGKVAAVFASATALTFLSQAVSLMVGAAAVRDGNRTLRAIQENWRHCFLTLSF